MDSVKSGIKKPGLETTGSCQHHSGQNHSGQNQLLQGSAHFSSRAVTPTNGAVSTNSGKILNKRSEQHKICRLSEQVLSAHLKLTMKEITTEKELTALLEKAPASADKSHYLKHVCPELLKRVLTSDFMTRYRLSFKDIPTSQFNERMAIKLLAPTRGRGPAFLKHTPEFLMTESFKQLCLDHHIYSVLAYLPENHGLRVDYDALVEKGPRHLARIPIEHQTDTRWRSVLHKDPDFIKYISPRHPLYEQLCLYAIARSPFAIEEVTPQESITERMLLCAETQGFFMPLSCIPFQLRTKDRCRKARQKEGFRIKDCPGIDNILSKNPMIIRKFINNPTLLEVLPDNLKTDELCREFLEIHPHILKGVPSEYMKHHPDCLEAATKRDGSNLLNIPQHLMTEDICRWAVEQCESNMAFVPDRFLDSLLPAAAWRCKLADIPEKYRTLDVYTLIVTATPSQFACVPENIRSQLPPELLLAVAPEYLPLELRQEMQKQGDTSLPEGYRSALPLRVSAQHLLSSTNPLKHVDDHSYGLLLRQQLLACQPFQLRNQQLGRALQEHVQQHIARRTHELTNKHLSELAAVPELATVYGGRSILFHDAGKCSRIKFLRKDESLDDFFREEAVHRFAADNAATLRLQSEVPQAVGIKLLPEEKLPASLKQQFRSTLELRTIHNQRFYVLYQFTTCDSDYSRYAYQPDEKGNTCQAELGIYKVCHDLGLWSSLGAVHTSTMPIFHTVFKDGRVERRYLIFLLAFEGNRSFPGALRSWEKATSESDWGYTGLRDIGDLEFYPSIQSYFSYEDNRINLPPSYDQRCAFMNAFCENMLAAVLHYVRLHRSEPDYNYRDEAGLTKLRRFLEQAVNSYLGGLLGSGLSGQGTTMADFFDSPETYQQWLSITAKEITLWTAPQETPDCVACCLEQTGHLPGEVYPDLIYTQTEVRYPDSFTDSRTGEAQLGASQCPICLTFLVKGLYQIAAGLSEKLNKHLNDAPVAA